MDSKINFIEPAFLGRDLKFRFNTYYRETDQQNADYNTRNIGISPSIEFPVSDNGRLELRYDTFMEELSTILQRHAGGAPG